MFLAELFGVCKWQIDLFIQTCREIGFPVSVHKTEGPTKLIKFLGLLIDLINKVVCIPEDKIFKATLLMKHMIEKKKTTLRELQQLCGFLNFLSKAIVPGRTFTRRLYNLLTNCKAKKPHHHLELTKDSKEDIKMWFKFIQSQHVHARSFFEFGNHTIYVPQFFFTDASKTRGCGGICDQEWFIMEWDNEELLQNFSINFLELYALTIAVVAWLYKFSNKPITIYCDNMSVVHMVNNGTSRNTDCMKLIRIIVLECLVQNCRLNVEYINTKANLFADHLSRLKYKEFW